MSLLLQMATLIGQLNKSSYSLKRGIERRKKSGLIEISIPIK